MDLLRFTTAGSINDGKSTLIGRLLYETSSIKEDILETIKVGGGSSEINLAFLTDGLRSEREQAITIDVAYKYFSTPHREYIISDAPGHFQYTRNLVSGASNVDVMIILIDALNGITEQTRRHSLVASFLRVPAVLIAVNKMDLLKYDERLFSQLRDEYLSVSEKLGFRNLEFIPISALAGDNVSSLSTNISWYTGKPLLEYLETFTKSDDNSTSMRLSIQGSLGSFYLGKMLSGKLAQGDRIKFNNDDTFSTIVKIIHNKREVEEAHVGQNITLTFTDGSQAKRGDLITHLHDAATTANRFKAHICWMDPLSPLEINIVYILKIHSIEVTCRISAITYKINNDNFVKYKSDEAVAVNDFAGVIIECDQPVSFDYFSFIRSTGRGILIDKETSATVGAFVITK